MNKEKLQRNGNQKKILISEINLKECPEGNILDGRNPNPELDSFFKKWEAPLAGGRRRRGLLRVIHEDGEPVIEHPISIDGKEVGFFEMEKCLGSPQISGNQYLIHRVQP